MESRIGRYIRRNHLGLIAVFVALGGTSYAANRISSSDIAKNAVRSKHIKAKQVKPGDLSPRARVSCPPRTKAFDHLCVRGAAAADGVGAEGTLIRALEGCTFLRLRLPTYGEASLLAVKHDVPGVSGDQAFWTDELTDVNEAGAVEESGFGFFREAATPSRIVCVTEPRKGA